MSVTRKAPPTPPGKLPSQESLAGGWDPQEAYDNSVWNPDDDAEASWFNLSGTHLWFHDCIKRASYSHWCIVLKEEKLLTEAMRAGFEQLEADPFTPIFKDLARLAITRQTYSDKEDLQLISAHCGDWRPEIRTLGTPTRKRNFRTCPELKNEVIASASALGCPAWALGAVSIMDSFRRVRGMHHFDVMNETVETFKRKIHRRLRWLAVGLSSLDDPLHQEVRECLDRYFQIRRDSGLYEEAVIDTQRRVKNRASDSASRTRRRQELTRLREGRDSSRVAQMPKLRR